jgi:phage gpG-like protein
MSDIKLEILLAQKAKEIQRYVKHDAPRVLAKLWKDHARESFENQGYTDSVFEPWQEVKRRMPEKAKLGKRGKPLKKQPVDYTRDILIGPKKAGGLKGSIRTRVINKDAVEISSDTDYAIAHNYGTETAGKNHNIKIPKRQFIGQSHQLRERIIAKFKLDIEALIK